MSWHRGDGSRPGFFSAARQRAISSMRHRSPELPSITSYYDPAAARDGGLYLQEAAGVVGEAGHRQPSPWWPGRGQPVGELAQQHIVLHRRRLSLERPQRQISLLVLDRGVDLAAAPAGMNHVALDDRHELAAWMRWPPSPCCSEISMPSVNGAYVGHVPSLRAPVPRAQHAAGAPRHRAPPPLRDCAGRPAGGGTAARSGGGTSASARRRRPG